MPQLLPDQPLEAHQQPWPLQQGQPLTEPKYTQQQCKCNKRQIGSEPKTPPQEQMH